MEPVAEPAVQYTSPSDVKHWATELGYAEAGDLLERHAFNGEAFMLATSGDLIACGMRGGVALQLVEMRNELGPGGTCHGGNRTWHRVCACAAIVLLPIVCLPRLSAFRESGKRRTSLVTQGADDQKRGCLARFYQAWLLKSNYYNPFEALLDQQDEKKVQSLS